MLEMDMEAHEAALDHERALTELTERSMEHQYYPDVAPRTRGSTHHTTPHSHSMRDMVWSCEDICM